MAIAGVRRVLIEGVKLLSTIIAYMDVIMALRTEIAAVSARCSCRRMAANASYYRVPLTRVSVDVVGPIDGGLHRECGLVDGASGIMPFECCSHVLHQ